ncbi:hypothetical protein Glove_329g31 [Diversispora epigaea]|uniref:Uncharacterized protein n=1 Tax=Diversispora epigaea TaxID=1348612 RepID=A0A397HK02_9GLOM|nr:hypothetical protein Glove_329g31 [Diversispora epigaea]
MYYRNNNRLAGSNKRYLVARKEEYMEGFSYGLAVEVNIAICYSCDQFVYVDKRLGYDSCLNYNMGEHWRTNCTGNRYCDISFKEYMELKQKPEVKHNIFTRVAIYRYELRIENLINRVKHIRETAKKIRAVNIIAQKWLEYMYRPDGLCASELAQHYQLLWAVREEMRQTIFSRCIFHNFHKAYSSLINKLPPSLVNKAWKRLISRKKNPMTEKEASAVNSLVELFLKHEVNRYQKKLKYQRKSWSLENLSHIYNIDMVNQESQTQDTVPICTCDHEEKINCRVKEELDNLSRQLLEYNEKTFGSFMQKITKQFEERDNANNKLRDEIKQQKIQLQEIERKLISSFR